MDSDPFVTDVLHVLSRYSETAKDALAGDVLEVPNGGVPAASQASERRAFRFVEGRANPFFSPAFLFSSCKDW